jgi:hypothetical protein
VVVILLFYHRLFVENIFGEVFEFEVVTWVLNANCLVEVNVSEVFVIFFLEASGLERLDASYRL